MMTREEQLKAIRERDAAYDGLFYFGVESTGIARRPSCRPNVPMEKSIVLFDTNEEAVNAGFRPCKICMKDK